MNNDGHCCFLTFGSVISFDIFSVRLLATSRCIFGRDVRRRRFNNAFIMHVFPFLIWIIIFNMT